MLSEGQVIDGPALLPEFPCTRLSKKSDWTFQFY